LKYSFHGYFPKKSKEDFKQLLNKSLTRIAYRGYISEEMGGEAMHILCDYSYKIKDCIENNNIQEGINILEATMETIGEFCIDGSNGEHGDIQDEFKETMELVLEKTSLEEKDAFLKWLKEYIKQDDEFIDFKSEFEDIYNKLEKNK